jgi:glycosyltransferase involved in cell wall biosynthesis
MLLDTNFLTPKVPSVDQHAVCGKYLRYPDLTGLRRAEGGLRLRGLFRESCHPYPLVTVVTTVRNASPFIERAICSVLHQTYPNLEYIVIDGCSTDSTLNKIEKYRDFLDYYISEPDTGLYHGMNKGIALATGDYVLILNADDWYAETAVQKLVNALQEKKVDLVSGLGMEMDRFGGLIRQIPTFPFKANVMMRMPLRHETMLVSKTLYNLYGPYDQSYRIIADLKFTARLYSQGISFYQLNEPLLFFRKIGTASVLNEDFKAERMRLLAENFPFLEQSELKYLANEYEKNIEPYARMYQKHCNKSDFIESLKSFLSLNNALGELQRHIKKSEL